MAGPAPIEVRLADLPQVQKFLASVNALLRTLAHAGDLPGPVMEAVARLRDDAAAPARDTAPQPSDEDRIRDAMAGAMDHPGRTITR
jgi:hypothetical protein